jgi:hypothetical protein
MDSDSFDDIPDEFEGIDFDAVPALSAPTPTPGMNTKLKRSSSPKSEYSFDDEFDAAFLAEVEALERLEQSKVASSSLPSNS